MAKQMISVVLWLVICILPLCAHSEELQRLREDVIAAEAQPHPRLAEALTALGLAYFERGVEADLDWQGPCCGRPAEIAEAPVLSGSVWYDEYNRLPLLRAQVNYAAAESCFTRALALYAAATTDDARLAVAHANLAAAHLMQKKYAAADAVLHRAAILAEKAMAPDDPRLAAIYTSQAVLLANRPLEHKGDAGREYYDEQSRRKAAAERLLRRALRLRELAYGADSPQTVSALLNLGRFYGTAFKRPANSREDDRAWPRFQQALAIEERLHPLGHPHRLAVAAQAGWPLESYAIERSKPIIALPVIAEYLAQAEAAWGKDDPRLVPILFRAGLCPATASDAAEGMLRRALALAEKSHGAVSEETAAALVNLAAWCARTGRQQEAAALTERAGKIREHARRAAPQLAAACDDARALIGLAPESPEAAAAFDRVMAFLRDEGNRVQYGAEVLAAFNVDGRPPSLFDLHGANLYLQGLRYLRIKQAVLGPAHPELLEQLQTMARTGRLGGFGDPKVTEPLYRQQLAIQEAVLGPDSPALIWILDALNEVCFQNGHDADQEVYLVRLLTLWDRYRKPEDGGDYLRTMYTAHLAECYRLQGKYAQEEQCYRQYFARAMAGKGGERFLTYLAASCQQQGKFAQAEEAYRQALAIAERFSAGQDYLVMKQCGELAAFYERRGAFDRALPLRQRALALSEKMVGVEKIDIFPAMAALARCVAALGRVDQAKILAERASAIVNNQPAQQRLDHYAAAADVYMAAGMPVEAERYFKRALPPLEKADAHTDALRAQVLERYAALLRSLQRPAEAERLEELAEEAGSAAAAAERQMRHWTVMP